MMALNALNRRYATLARLAGLALICWSVITSDVPPGLHGRGLLVAGLLVVLIAAWLAWTAWSSQLTRLTPDLHLIALASAVLAVAAPSSGASAGAFLAPMAASARTGIRGGLVVVALSVLAMGGAALAYDWSALGVLAYSGGWCAMALAGANLRQMRLRADQAELLLAQTQRSHEEELRVTRLQEQARIAREIHDVLAHSLAGLTIQLEATAALIEQGADPQTIRERVVRAHQLARDGLRETRRAVGALREAAPEAGDRALRALVDEYRAGADGVLEFELRCDPALLSAERGETVLRVVQEALTNVRKHAPGAAVAVSIAVEQRWLVVRIADRAVSPVAARLAPGLAGTGGGYGIRGMRERAQLLGGTLRAGPTAEGWLVELRLPVEEPE